MFIGFTRPRYTTDQESFQQIFTMRNVFIVASALMGIASALPQKTGTRAAPIVPELGSDSIATGGIEPNVKRQASAPVPGDGSVAAYREPRNALRMASQTAVTPAGYKEVFTDFLASTEKSGK